MNHRGWQVESGEPGKIIADYGEGGYKHVVKETIQYNNKRIRITYLDSYNMRYEMGPSVDVYRDPTDGDPVPWVHHKCNS